MWLKATIPLCVLLWTDSCSGISKIIFIPHSQEQWALYARDLQTGAGQYKVKGHTPKEPEPVASPATVATGAEETGEVIPEPTPSEESTVDSTTKGLTLVEPTEGPIIEPMTEAPESFTTDPSQPGTGETDCEDGDATYCREGFEYFRRYDGDFCSYQFQSAEARQRHQEVVEYCKKTCELC